MNITVERGFKKIAKVAEGSIIYLCGNHYIVTEIILEEERVLINLANGLSSSVSDTELVRYLNDEFDSTKLVESAELTVRGYLNN